MARLKVVHTFEFNYSSKVVASYNEVRFSPSQELDQTVLSRDFSVEPPTPLRSTRDAFGTTVHEFEILAPHERMVLRAESVVTVQRSEAPAAPVPLSLAEAQERAASRLDIAETLILTPLTAPHPEVIALARELLDQQDVDATARAIAARVKEGIEYQSGVTTVHSRADEVWDLGRGVCQDIAHVVLGALRSIGIPARYVSGYLHPKREPELDVPVKGEAHAWVEWYAGRWIGYDPTNSIPIGNRHVVVGRGRDYRDVPPLRGVFDGEGTSEMDVSVEVTLVG